MTSKVLPQDKRQVLRRDLTAADDGFITKMPKVELHTHIEGAVTPELRWELAKRHGMPARLGKRELSTLPELQQAYMDVISQAQLPSATLPREQLATFFEAYFSGFQYLKTRKDFYDLAWAYFERAASMNVRYCEVFCDLQGHTSRGVSVEDVMLGFRDAQKRAANELNVHAQWIVCFLRDHSPEEAEQLYADCLKYRDMIVGFGLDANERDRPPSLFDSVFRRARAEGFKVTAHCDVGVKDTHEHIRQVASTVAGGLDRIDHGLNTADVAELIELVKERELALTICPWAYLRRETYESIAERLKTLVDSGVTVCIASDSASYMDDCWVTHNLMLARQMGGFTNAQVGALVRNAAEVSWAPAHIKVAVLGELDEYLKTTLR